MNTYIVPTMKRHRVLNMTWTTLTCTPITANELKQNDLFIVAPRTLRSAIYRRTYYVKTRDILEAERISKGKICRFINASTLKFLLINLNNQPVTKS